MDRIVYVNMERHTVNALVETTGWPYVWQEKLSALMDKTGTWWDWRNHRLAYGAQRRGDDPTQLKWAPRPIGGAYEPSLGEFFKDVTLCEGEDYYLLITKIDGGLRDLHNRLNRHTSPWEKELLWKFRALYPLKPAGNEHAMKGVKPRVAPDGEGGASDAPDGEGGASRRRAADTEGGVSRRRAADTEGGASRKRGAGKMNALLEQLKFIG
jgi:hypothetical protein